MSLSVGGIVSLGGGTSGGGHSTSGIISINGQLGPAIIIDAGSGIQINTSNNRVTINASGTGSSNVSKYSAVFSSITSGIFNHNLATLDVLVQVWSAPGGGARAILPDQIIVEDLNHVSLIFNRPRSGKVVII